MCGKKAADMTKDRIDLQQVYYSMQWNQTAGCRKETLAQSSSHLHQDWWCFFAAWCASIKQNCMWSTVYCICTQWLLAPTAANAISDGNEFAVSTDTHLSPPLALCLCVRTHLCVSNCQKKKKKGREKKKRCTTSCITDRKHSRQMLLTLLSFAV